MAGPRLPVAWRWMLAWWIWCEGAQVSVGRSRTPAMTTLLMTLIVCEDKLDCGASAAGEYLCDGS